MDGRIDAGTYTIDFGSVIPSALQYADLPDLVALMAPRPVLACGFRDASDPVAATTAVRFRNALHSPVANQSEYSPASPLDAARLVTWLERSEEARSAP